MKKLLSLILAITMIVTAMPMAFASDEVTSHTHSMSTDCSTVNGEQIEFEPINFNEEYSNFYKGGNYYLTADCEDSINFAGSEPVRICLNGYKMKSFKRYKGVIEICDCKGTGSMGMVRVQEKSTFNMYGGKIISKSFYEADQCVEVERDATFNFYGGSMFSETWAMRVYGTANIYCSDIVCTNFAEYDIINGQVNIECDYKQCNHMCHKTNYFTMWFWFYINLFNAIFGINETCKCGVTHYQK